MIFSSVLFLFYFFPAVLFCYFIIRKDLRNLCLLLFSLFFYAWGEPRFILFLLLSITVNYLAGLGIDAMRGTIWAKACMLCTILVNMGGLFFYKYINFAIKIVNGIMHRVYPEWNAISSLAVALPIGLSFFTFQGLSYVIDVYRGDVPVQKNPLHIALYISLYPQLIAGPIVRYADVYKEILHRESTLNDIEIGTRRFIIGLAKKVMLADILASVADKIFGLPADQLTTSTAWLGAVCYTFQIYFDFSGYSDMAIGMGRIFGFHFLENFNLPYISTSVTEFWRRWHISLSTWFRDYLYIPLGGNRRGNVYVNLFIVFLCTGLWHGAAFTFLFWGLWHGAFLIIERVGKLKGVKIPVPKIIKWCYTALVVILGWVLFRSDGIRYAVSYVKAMFGIFPDTFRLYGLPYYIDGQVIATLIAALVISLGLPRLVYDRLQADYSGFSDKFSYVKIAGLWLLLFTSMCMIVNGNYSPFIYFRF